MIGYEATLRWLMRDGQPVLQQWYGSPYQGEVGEWRDVPTVDASQAGRKDTK